jgi:hypothetical protein
LKIRSNDQPCIDRPSVAPYELATIQQDGFSALCKVKANFWNCYNVTTATLAGIESCIAEIRMF